MIVESPNKVIKIESLLSDPHVIADWSFDKHELKQFGKGPEKAIAMATTGHFMTLSELTWNPQPPLSTPLSSSDFPPNGVLATFALQWSLQQGRRIQDTVSHYIEEKADNLSEIIIATDPDREGELIAVHALNLIRRMFPQLSVPFTRAYMHSITADGIQAAMQERRTTFDHNLANAAEARHAMDRMFGFLGSSVVRFANPQMRSIGRVQTPALILINDRETKIQAFLAAHSSTYEVHAMCHFTSSRGQRFTQIVAVVPENADAAAVIKWSDKAPVQKLCEEWKLRDSHHFHKIGDCIPAETVSPPPEPFTMATLITKANRQFYYSSDKVSACLQDLFQMGFITYPRTDSCRIDEAALTTIYEAVVQDYGPQLLQRRQESGTAEKTSTSRKRSKKVVKQQEVQEGNVEDAHEAIRPTNIHTKPEDLGSVSTPMKQIYDLIRRQTLAAFMIPMRSERLSVTIGCTAANGAPVKFQLQGRHVVEPGWSAAFRSGKGTASELETDQDVQTIENGGQLLPSISDEEFRAIVDVTSAFSEGRQREMSLESSQVVELSPTPPLPYSEGGLIEELRSNGVGRPSTYPLIVKTLLARSYITINRGRCETTPIGRLVVETSRSTFPSIVDIGFTSSFEKKLDRVAKPTGAASIPVASGRNMTEADCVLSSFISNFLNYVTDATKVQRAIVFGEATLQGPAADGEKRKAAVVVPDLVENVKQYRTFTALQNSLTDYLRRYFPLSPESRKTSYEASLSPPTSAASNSRSWSSSSSSYSGRSSYRKPTKAEKRTPRRFRATMKK